MANSSFNSSFSLHNATPKQAEEAFEELYMRSPMPKLTKPLSAIREKWAAFPMASPAHGGSKVKIKAIFDTMKERNSSMCSELNSSICTSNTSFGDADVESRLGKDCARPTEKENQTPSPDTDLLDEVDHSAESGEGPRNGNGQLPPVPESPAMRVALNFARHAARVDALSAGRMTTDRETQDTRPEPTKEQARRRGGDLESCSSRERQCNKNTSEITAPTTSRRLTRNRQLTNTGDTITDCEVTENMTEEICLPLCRGSAQVTAVQNMQNKEGSPPTLLSATATLESATGCPNNKSSIKSGGDQETLQLVSKLVQRLQSASGMGSDDSDGDDSDNWDPVSKPASTQAKGSCAAKDVESSKSTQRMEKAVHGETGAETSNQTSVKARTANSKRKTEAVCGEGPENRTSDQSAKHAAEKSTKGAFALTMRTRTMGPAVAEASGDEVNKKKKPAGKPRQKKEPGRQNTRDNVEADIVGQRAVKPAQSTKDLFGPNVSSDENVSEVDEDAIACATRKSCRSETTKRKGAADAAKGAKSAPQVTRKGGRVAATAGEDRNKVLKLSDWSLQPIARLKSVRVEGKLPNSDYFWLSSVVVERISSRVLKTTNGSLYQLVGNMATLNTRAAGFSAELTQLFKRGFPVDWKELLESSVAFAELNSKTLLTSTLPASSKEHTKPKEKITNQRTAPPRKKKTTANANSFRTPQRVRGDTEDGHTIWTPRGVVSRMVGAKDVRRTKSGRCVIPPLARWAGQYMQRDDDGNVTIGFQSLAAEKYFAVMAQHELCAPPRLRNSPMPTKMTKIRKKNSSVKDSPRQQSRASHSAAGIGGKKSAGTLSHTAAANKASRKEANDDQSVLPSGHNTANETSLEEEIMSLIQQSKAKRLQKSVQKRKTCYSKQADDSQQTTNKRAPHSLENTDKDKEFCTQKVVGETRLKPVSVCITKLPEEIRQNVSENLRLTGKDKQKRNGQQSPTNPPEKDTKGRTRGKTQLAVSDGDEAEPHHGTSAGNKDPGRRATRGRKPKQSQPIMSDPDDRDSDEGRDVSGSALTNSISSSASASITPSKDAHRKRGPTQSAITDRDTSDPDCKTRRKGLRTRGKKSYQEVDNGGIDWEPSSEGSGAEDSEEKEGHRKRRAGNRSTRQRLQARNTKGGWKKAPSKTGKADSLQKENLSESDGTRPWSKKEIQNLHRGIESISSDHPEYWEAVSQYVGSRSSKECAAFHLKDDMGDKRPNGKAKEKKTKQTDKTPVLHAKRGTLKRRQEKRAVWEHVSNGNNSPDDLFGATPFRTKKRAKVAAIDFSKTDEDVFGRNPNFFTPRNDGVLMGRAVSHTPASSRKTPTVAITNSPWHSKDSAQKRDIDQYIFRHQKNKRQHTRSFNKKKTEQSEEKEAGASGARSVRLFNQPSVPEGLFDIVEERSGNEEENSDFYYSEEEN
ncbi:uncharacterized protein LOC143296106 isoform X2 [Babylonia areolata]|uniref:uncharacterized protein LOC143296106 isoform X2 n=1 Tax=Babylonia areolata TaxID=304850 RepID=UPI003FD410FB